MSFNQNSFADTVDHIPTLEQHYPLRSPVGSHESSRFASSRTDATNLPEEFYQKYQVIEYVASGLTASVYKAVCTQSHQIVCAKIINKAVYEECYEEVNSFSLNAAQEAKIMKQFNHPNIPRLLDFFENSDKACIVMEFKDGKTLLELINDGTDSALSNLVIHHLFVQLAQAVTYIHTCGFCHRDIKPENILVDDHYQLALIDFGFCAPINSKAKTLDESKNLSNVCGTSLYLAPEVILDERYNGSLADMWSLGIVLYTMVYKGVPYELEEHEFDQDEIIFEKIVRYSYEHEILTNRNTSRLEGITFFCRDLLKKLLEPNTEKRLQSCDLFFHPYISVENNGNQLTKAMTDLPRYIKQSIPIQEVKTSICNHKSITIENRGLLANKMKKNNSPIFVPRPQNVPFLKMKF
ncbi:CAMK family protein kinase [Tritrichomonas foetus]|uniref:CAMK family protein kinase n=1 Tax=Tritrichomonas foetus TaxID=1144522 RepID=A0A1J4KBP9_9EUKA|nr:CAMK family protein kinase [Tritrichomonas foetus]|eukprot:OHT08394.1 CAMK family protein kinase [Tritrichomonas foetus]